MMNMEMDDIEIIEMPEERGRTTVFTDEFFLAEKELKDAVAKFFHPTSQTNVTNMDAETRQSVCRYAAALFEWIVCIQNPAMLTELDIPGEDLPPFPVTPDTKRMVVRQGGDHGKRMFEVWRQNKSLGKLANHFKLKEEYALLTLFDYGFSSPEIDVDVFPLLRLHEISQLDYYALAKFVITNCDARSWQRPEMMIVDTLMPPLTLAIALYVLHTEVTRAAQLPIPWEELDNKMDTIRASMSDGMEEAMLEAFNALNVDDSIKNKYYDMNVLLNKTEKSVNEMQSEITKLQNQIALKRKETEQLKVKAGIVVTGRRAAFDNIKPANFEENGFALATADVEFIGEWKEGRRLRRFMRNRMKGSKLMARRREDASEPFQEGILNKMEARKTGTGVQIEPAVPDGYRRSKKAIEVKVLHHTLEKMEYKPDMYHGACTKECLKGKDMDSMDRRFTKENISPFYVPIICGWRRFNQDFYFSKSQGSIYYRAPCGRSLLSMKDVLNYLDETGSELTVDSFSFNPKLDETSYVYIDKQYVKDDDISHGSEGRPISAINDVDNEPLPPFTYRARRYPFNEQVAEAITASNKFCSGCDCTDDCRDWTKCACQRLTHRESVRAYSTFKKSTMGYTNRLLLERVATGIYECNENCQCSRKRCLNRVVQGGLKVPMQMMKTTGMGWGVRALVDIPKGTFISCYHGAVLSDAIAELNNEGDEYYAELDFYDIVETDKMSSGIDGLADQGVFFEDVGARDLTESEIRKAEEEDELDTIRKDEEAMKKIKKREERAERRRQAKGQGQGQGQGQGEREREEGVMEGQGQGQGQGGQEEEGEGENGQEDGANTADEIDEGIDERESMDSADSQDEERDNSPGSSSSPDEEKKKEEEEMRKKKKEEGRRIEKMRKVERDRQKRILKESKKRFTIPIMDENGMNQLDTYFESGGLDSLFIIDAKSAGNIGRQYNHGCDPNMFTQHIFVDTHDIRLPWSAFFAKKDIKAGEELLWDYGWNPGEISRGLKCQCGAENCRVDLL